ncbi:hypothetical protein BB561_003920 [Smittium simulii]|uniref:DNA-directed RNA polymerase RpoA/D/Rpb3-type domain-containing protein n=1 Tax=Smittium simulii TaxID=133385 RepID=A0A2T9YJ23_9FUNG|nr:hypothetical protein BB561_003920 [Smittium simulii]
MLPDDNTVKILADQVLDVSSTDHPHYNPYGNNDFSIQHTLKNLKIKISKISTIEMEFDLIGVDASFANALRRIMISEIPTMAIEKVYMLNNTVNEDPTDQNTIVFKLDATCQYRKGVSASEPDPNKKYINSSIFSNQLVWDPKGDQAQRFTGPTLIAPVHGDILITKLRPGQEIQCELHCQKGIGRDHSKFSPVATASYRLLPKITILQDIIGDDAYKFQNCFPPGTPKAKVLNPRKDTVSREVLRHKEFKDKVKLERVRDHFIFNIESTGAISPPEILHMSIEILASKCQNLKQSISSLLE